MSRTNRRPSRPTTSRVGVRASMLVSLLAVAAVLLAAPRSAAVTTTPVQDDPTTTTTVDDSPVATLLTTTTSTIAASSTTAQDDATTTTGASTATTRRSSGEGVTTVDPNAPAGADLLVPGDGTEGAESTTPTVRGSRISGSGPSDGTLISLVIVGLVIVAVAIGILTWRYWAATRPPLIESDAGPPAE